MNNPIIFSDLDDTLFQTRRKMQNQPENSAEHIGALDQNLLPRSFMNEEQAMLVKWMLAHAELIPVTARGTEEIQRVMIPFHSWSITTHGAVILDPNGLPDKIWQAQIISQLTPYSDKLVAMQQAITALMKQRNLEAWARINYEYEGLPIYLVMKHRNNRQLHELYALADEIEQLFSTQGFYIHRNNNNIAWIPKPVEKGLAVNYLLNKLRQERGLFPVIGLGDSLSDYTFLKYCSWYGVPHQSQFAAAIAETIFGEK